MRVLLLRKPGRWVAHVVDRDDFRNFAVVLGTSGPPPERCEGVRFDDGSAWVDSAWLAWQANCLVGVRATSLEAMIGFARSRGWFCDERGEIKAHIEQDSM